MISPSPIVSEITPLRESASPFLKPRLPSFAPEEKIQKELGPDQEIKNIRKKKKHVPPKQSMSLIRLVKSHLSYH